MGSDATSEVVELQVTYDPDDYTRYWLFHYCERAAYRVPRAISILFATFFALIGLVATDALGRVVWLSVAALFASYYTLLLPRSLRKAAAASFATYLSMQQPTRFLLSADEVAVESAWASGKYSWQAYWKAAETKHDFYIYLANTVAHMLPKRCFASPEDMQRFREIVRAAMGERAKGI